MVPAWKVIRTALRGFIRFAVMSALIASASLAQIPFPLIEIDEIGHLGTSFDERDAADLDFAEAIPESGEVIRLEGRDDKGRLWRAWLPRYGGIVGDMRVFHADLDANGRTDLLVSNVAMGNGRCAGDGDVVTLMFDSRGRPMPWRMDTRAMIYDDGDPVLVVDLNGDGRAELVTSDCEYSFRDEYPMGAHRWITGVYEARDSRWFPLQAASVEPYLEALKQRFAKPDPAYLDWTPSPDPISPDPLEGWGERPMTRVTGVLTREIGCVGSAIGAADDREPGHGCTPLIGSNRIRFADGTVRSGWPAVVRESPSGREIFMADPRETLKTVVAAGSSFRPLGPESKPAFLWIDAPADAPIRPMELRVAARVVRSTAIERTAPAGELATKPTGHLVVGPDGIVPTPGPGVYSSPESATDTGTLGIRFDRFVRIPEGAAERSATLAPEPRRGHFFSRNGRCYFMPGLRSGARAVQVLDDCAELAPLEAEAKGGERVLVTSFRGQPRTISPEGRSYRSMTGFGSPGNRVFREITFENLPFLQGKVIGAVQFEPYWLVEWESETARWFAVHDESGKPQSGALEIGVDGELLDGDIYKGLEFLRWADGVPVESSIVHLTLEWVASN